VYADETETGTEAKAGKFNVISSGNEQCATTACQPE
jgi:hypothetical protein